MWKSDQILGTILRRDFSRFGQWFWANSDMPSVLSALGKAEKRCRRAANRGVQGNVFQAKHYATFGLWRRIGKFPAIGFRFPPGWSTLYPVLPAAETAPPGSG